MKLKSNLGAVVALAIVTILMIQTPAAHAKGGTTDPIPGTSKSGLNSGGTNSGGSGGGESTTTTTTTNSTTTTSSTLPAGPITFSASGPVNGIVPVCTGDYQESAYYPTLLDMTINVNVSSLDVPDGTVLYLSAVPAAGGALYPYTSSAIVITTGSGTCSEHLFVTVGASLAGVMITDGSGNVLFVGN